MTVTASPPRPPADRVARIVTEVLAPGVLVAALLVVTGWQAGSRAGGSRWWGLAAAVFAAGVPMAYVLRGVRAGRYRDHHIPERERRRTPLLVGAGCVLVGSGVLAAVGAPRDVVALLGAGLAGLLVFVLVTHWWKVSIHAGVAAGTVAVLIGVLGPAAVTGTVLVALVGWARVRLRAHTVAQVVVGAVLGALIAGTVFPALR